MKGTESDLAPQPGKRQPQCRLLQASHSTPVAAQSRSAPWLATFPVLGSGGRQPQPHAAIVGCDPAQVPMSSRLLGPFGRSEQEFQVIFPSDRRKEALRAAEHLRPAASVQRDLLSAAHSPLDRLPRVPRVSRAGP